MITGEIRSKIDAIWNAFWAGGISNPLEVIEQITYLLFMRRLDDLHTLEENKANPTEETDGATGLSGRERQQKMPVHFDLRWSRFKHKSPSEMYTIVGEHGFPFLRTLGGAFGLAQLTSLQVPPRCPYPHC
ncbi:type I restriction-modification system subunit M N-terminal domain-containing protein [Anatilimnocola sp. NA78]|uniref:type I restriction-modification system subunit M N-terminal domain-containing protein n=1 Tax=Anatilimnocola sp. NA78 TaxID=3415683 RepID=UPI003CE4FA19